MPVMILLFCLMAVIAGLSKIGFFDVLSLALIRNTGSLRSLSFLLVMLCFFSSMLVTNDVALITFVPLAIALLQKEKPSVVIHVIVLQTIAANLGSMMTPIGNPQNLYLYSFYQIPLKEFLGIMFPMVFISFLLITAGISPMGDCKKSLSNFQAQEASSREEMTSPLPYHYLFYGILFLICLLAVFHILSVWVCLILVTVGVAFADKSVFRRLDYGLLATFFFFFIFTGNMSKIPWIYQWISEGIAGRELFFSVFLSQFISNVPAALMLSKFTDHYALLLQGVNLGGLGTLVASLASLISFRYYMNMQGANLKAYLFRFTMLNGTALGVLSAYLVFFG